MILSKIFRFLKKPKSLRRDELISLVKMGADPVDCHIQVFEDADAINTPGPKSLKWLAAQAATKLPKESTKVLPDGLPEVIEASKPYVGAR